MVMSISCVLDERPLLQVHHDESAFYANVNHWADDKVRILKQKSLGQANMVSDFIEEATGDCLQHDGDEARVLLKTKTL